MPRQLNLRQIEAFKAVMEHGTVSRGAQMLNISQPAMSKLIAHLEADTGLKLFDRLKGRLAPTENALRLHDEVERIFAGVRQVESAIDAIRREEQGRLMMGVIPALAGSFIQRATTRFLDIRSNVFCSVQPLSSQWIVDRLVARTLDVGLITATIDNPYVVIEPLMEHPLVCIMPLDHPLADRARVNVGDLAGLSFISFNSDSHAGARVHDLLELYNVSVQVALVAGAAPTVCEFVAAGLGISLVHPLMAAGLEDRLAIRPFDPEVLYKFQIARSADSRNARLVDEFVQMLLGTANEVSASMLEKR